MSAIIQQIKTAYEVSGLTPELIAQEQDLDVTAVKAALMQASSLYRKECGAESADEENLNFSNDQLRRVNDVIYDVALSASLSDGSVDYRTRFVAAAYIRDDKKGRKEARQLMQGNTFNILNFNEQLAKARQMATNIKQKLIEV